MSPLLALAWWACSAPAGPTGPLAVPAPSGARLDEGPVLRGLCDASAGVWVDGRLWVADDEMDVLRAFGPDGAEVDRFDVGPLLDDDPKEADLEGVARAAEGGLWWIGSHDRGTGTEPVPRRQHLFLTDLGTRQLRAHRTDLLARMAAHPELGPLLARTAGHTSKDRDGFSIEGLAWADDQLLVGLRAPIVDDRALLVTVRDPEGVAELGLRRLDLGGRGIRALEHHQGALWIVAGAADEEVPFALFRLEGDTPVEVPVALGDLRPEGLASDGANLWLLSDDGGSQVDGTKCKKAPEASRRARTARLTTP